MKKLLIFTVFAFVAFAAGAHAQSYTFNNDLRLGSTGQDVVNLQTWLIANGYNILSISNGTNVKGYYGFQTMSAVSAYQQAIGLPSYGFFGPMTRAYWFGHQGNGGGDNNYRGDSLRVTSPNGGEVWQRGTTQYITWTGASGVLNQMGYIKLEFAVPACAEPTANPRCMIAVRAPITIASGVNLGSGSYAWNVGNTLSDNVPDGQYKIQICPTNGSQCDDSDNYFNITTNGTTNGQAPVVSEIDAPTSLVVNQTGTWTIHATDPQNSTLGYSIDWGDTVYTATGYAMTASAPKFTQTTTFTHSYSNPGTYTVRVTVRDALGLSTQTTSTVQVTSSNTTAGPLRIISPNGGEIWQKGTTQNITWTSPYYFAAAYADLKITQTYNCTGQVCPAIAYAPYTIATNIPINQNSYSWNVGTAINYSGISQTMNDGQYTMMICQTGTNNCDTSDNTFTITQ